MIIPNESRFHLVGPDWRDPSGILGTASLGNTVSTAQINDREPFYV